MSKTRHFLVGDVAYPSSNISAREFGRPVVVIDPQDLPEVERLRSLLGVDIYTDHLSNALAAFANPTPPKPEEPTGLGAVVEDAFGYCWVRVYRPIGPQWRHLNDSRHYADIEAVRVLSEGWSE